MNNSSSRAAPSVSSPALEIDGGAGGQETGEVETADPGGDDEVESIVLGGHDDVESIGPEGQGVEAEATSSSRSSSAACR